MDQNTVVSGQRTRDTGMGITGRIGMRLGLIAKDCGKMTGMSEGNGSEGHMESELGPGLLKTQLCFLSGEFEQNGEKGEKAEKGQAQTKWARAEKGQAKWVEKPGAWEDFGRIFPRFGGHLLGFLDLD